MRLGILYSGGENSNYAMYVVSKFHDISLLINIVPKDKNSYLYHSINNNIVDLQAKALVIDLYRQYSEGNEYMTYMRH